MNTLLKLSVATILATSLSSAVAGMMPPPGATPPPPPGATPPPPAEDVRFAFAADLSSAQAGVISDATGDVTLDFADDLSSATYTLNVANSGTITAAHFHCAAAGVNGPPAVTIQVGTTTITNADIRPVVGNAVCGVTINNIASLLNATLQGVIYANIHTDLFPAGELRGQIFAPIAESDQ
ncbi:hypothetical protein MNBD_GAMMA08-799 [hydrothermal vent metagenome]|uniref:CHRD domain-containing protein n=1 Tax=hydrothermal vent metagenome TaxID=652676 RepID=A0A3B0WSN1_9ZZZZ